MKGRLVRKQNKKHSHKDGNNPRRRSPMSQTTPMMLWLPGPKVKHPVSGIRSYQENKQNRQQEKKQLKVDGCLVELGLVTCVLREPQQENNYEENGEQWRWWWCRHGSQSLACPPMFPLWTPSFWMEPLHVFSQLISRLSEFCARCD